MTLQIPRDEQDRLVFESHSTLFRGLREGLAELTENAGRPDHLRTCARISTGEWHPFKPVFERVRAAPSFMPIDAALLTGRCLRQVLPWPARVGEGAPRRSRPEFRQRRGGGTSRRSPGRGLLIEPVHGAAVGTQRPEPRRDSLKIRRGLRCCLWCSVTLKEDSKVRKTGWPSTSR